MKGHLDPDALLRAIDSRDPDAFLLFLTQDATFKYGSLPALSGNATIREFLEGFYPTLASISHHKLGFWEAEEGSVVFLQGEVTYGYPNGQTVTVPFLNLLRMREGLILEYTIYIDPTPAIAAMTS